MNIKRTARKIVKEYFGGYMPNSLADEGMKCSDLFELYGLIEKIESYFMSEHPTADFSGVEYAIHLGITKIVDRLNKRG